MVEPKHLAYLATSIELGSVTKAAKRLNMTQPSLSRMVRIIEDRVGGEVLRRGRHGVSPTEIGAALAADGREIILRSQQAESKIKQWRKGLAGELRIGVGPLLAATVISDFLVRCIESPPGYQFKVFCNVPAQLVADLRAGRLDAAIMPYDLNLRDEALIRERLFHDRLAVFVAKDDPLGRKAGVQPQELTGHSWISVGHEAGLFDVTRELLDYLGLQDVEPKLQVDGDVSTTIAVLSRTRSCCMLPSRLLAAFGARLGIAPVDLARTLPARDGAFWTTPAGRDRRETVDFIARLRRHLAQHGLVDTPG